MKQYQGIWMPTTEVELVDWMTKNKQLVDGKGTYQYPKFEAAMQHCTSFRTCIDQGSHIGLWTMHLAKRFDSVLCFEPVLALARCWDENMRFDPNLSKCKIFNLALGKEPWSVMMASNVNACGDSWIDTDGAEKRKIYGAVAEPVGYRTRMITIDSLDLIDVDFMKVDAEGYEENILRGAERTIRQWRPTIIVEQKRDMACKFGLQPKGAIQYLEQAHDYRVVRELGGDFVMVAR